MSEPDKRKVLTWRSVMAQLEKKGESVVIVRQSNSGVKVYSTSNLSDQDVCSMLRRAAPDQPADAETSTAESEWRLPPAEQLLPHRRKPNATQGRAQRSKAARLGGFAVAAASVGVMATGLTTSNTLWLATGTSGLACCLALLVMGRIRARRSDR